MAVKIIGNTGGIVETSNNTLHINTPTDETVVGYISIVAEGDPGSVIDKTVRPLDPSLDYRLRVGIDNLLWDDVFNHAIFNTSVYQGVTSTMTVTVGSGALNLNAGSSVTGSAVARVQTYKTFPVFGTYPLYVDMWVKFSDSLPGEVYGEFGLGYAATTVTPTDGIYFKVNNGVLKGTCNYAGVETNCDISLVPDSNNVYHFLIAIHNDLVEFWIDDIKYGEIVTNSAQGGGSKTSSLPVLLRLYNGSGGASASTRLQIHKLNVSLGDTNAIRPWANVMSGMGLSAVVMPPGATVGQLANYANSAAPASATLSNTTAGYGPTLLGGQWQFAAVGGAETDYILFAYLVPAGSATIPGKTLFITGVRIDTYNTGAASATTATVLQWGLGLGATAITLATADSATAGTRSAKRILLGTQSIPVTTPIGGPANQPIAIDFTTPLMVEAGTYLQLLLKMPIGTATASQVIRGTAIFNGYFE